MSTGVQADPGPGLRVPARGGGGPPLVLLHGFLGTPSAWSAVLDALPQHGEAWCPWLPGHGPAAPTPTDWDSTVRGLAAAVPEGAVLAGYSLGARLALATALELGPRLRAAVLVGGHVGLASNAERAERAALDGERAAALKRDLQAFVTEWEALPLFATQASLPASAQAAQRDARLSHDAQALVWAFDVAGLAQMPDLRLRVAASERPLCFVTGALDTRFTALAAGLVRPPWVSHRVVPAAGHNLLLEAPAKVASALGAAMVTPCSGAPCCD